MRLIALGVGVVALSAGLSAQGGGPRRGGRHSIELPAKLRAALEKSKSLRFSGIRKVTLVRAGRPESFNEAVTKDGKKLRIEFSKDSPYAGQIIVETEAGRRHFFPDKNLIRETGATGRFQFEGLGMLRGVGRKLKLTEGGRSVIAGVEAEKFEIADDRGNRVAEFDVDLDSGLVLRRVIYDPSGSVAGSFEFSKVVWNPKIQAGAFAINRKGATVIRPIDDARALASRLKIPLNVTEVVSGYKLQGAMKRTVDGNDVLMLFYGKEGARLSLFAGYAPSKERRLPPGMTSYQWNRGGVYFVLLGEETEATLRAIATKIDD